MQLKHKIRRSIEEIVETEIVKDSKWYLDLVGFDGNDWTKNKFSKIYLTKLNKV